MKKIILFIALLFLLVNNALAAGIAANVVWEIRQAPTAATNSQGCGFVWTPLVDGTNTWTASASGTNEYYCKTGAGTCAATQPTAFMLDGIYTHVAQSGTLGSLAAGNWGYGDNDTLGFNTVYVRLTNGLSPVKSGLNYVGMSLLGTDRSQADASFKTATDLVIADGDAIPGVVTSATNPFATADVDNLLHITAGTSMTQGWYRIVSVDGSANATLDRAAGTVDGQLTGGTYYVGGACSLNSATANRTDDNLLDANANAGHIYFVKYSASAYTLNATTIAQAGTAASPIILSGYSTVRSLLNTDSDRPTLNNGGTGTTFATNWAVRNLIFTGSANTAVIGNNINSFRRVKVSNTSSGATKVALSLAGAGTVINSELTSAGSGESYGVQSSGTGAVIYGNYIYSSSPGVSGCVNLGVGVNTVAYNILSGCSKAVNITATYDYQRIVNNTMFGAETPAGTAISGADSEQDFIVGNLIYGFTTGVTYTAEAKTNFFAYNNYYNNTANYSNVTPGVGDTFLDPALTCTAAANCGTIASADFKPGVFMKAGAFPGAFPGSATTGYLDKGAVQRQEGAGGGGAWVF